MSLEKKMQFNDLSPKLRAKLEEKVRGFGKLVRYKFEISNPNPDPQKYNGATLWPNVYTLDPTVFNILDPMEDRKSPEGSSVSKSKRIALIIGEDDKGVPNKFKKIRVEGKHFGVLTLHIEEGNEDWYTAIYLELHPKMNGGDFSDKTKQQVFSRIDEVKVASAERVLRSARKKAMDIAENMEPQEVIDFADAMSGGGSNIEWDSTQDERVLRNKIESLAETSPDFFNELVASKEMEIQALIRKAITKEIISFNPAENKFIWVSNQQTAGAFQPLEGKNEIQMFAELIANGGAKMDEVYKKIKSMVNGKKEAVA